MRSLRSWLPDWGQALKVRLGRDVFSISPAPQTWRGLYVAALVENDKGRTPQRIADAKHALVTRARELFRTTGDHQQEQSAIDDALQVLRVLERCRPRSVPTGAD